VIGLFFGRLRVDGRDDQPLVRFARLDVQLFNLRLGPKRLFNHGDGVLSLPDRLFSGADRPFTAVQRLLLHAERVLAGRRLLRDSDVNE
jgi:hypothetical protein